MVFRGLKKLHIIIIIRFNLFVTYDLLDLHTRAEKRTVQIVDIRRILQ
jgi:hypothetical protein